MSKPRPVHRHPLTLGVFALLTAALLVAWVGEIDLGLDALFNPPDAHRAESALPKPTPTPVAP